MIHKITANNQIKYEELRQCRERGDLGVFICPSYFTKVTKRVVEIGIINVLVDVEWIE